MKKQNEPHTLVRKSERALARVEKHAAGLRREASGARLSAFIVLPFGAAPVWGVLAILSGGMTLERLIGDWIQLFMLVVCVVLVIASVLGFRWLMHSALDFDRQATKAIHKFASSPGAPSSRINASKLPASISSGGIKRRLALTFLRRVWNTTMLLGALSIFALGVITLYMFISTVTFSASMNRLNFMLLATGVLGVTAGATCCAILLKSGQRLLEVHESLVEVGAYVAKADAEPGSLQLSSSVSQGGQLSMEVQDGALTQARDDEHP